MVGHKVLAIIFFSYHMDAFTFFSFTWTQFYKDDYKERNEVVLHQV